MSTSAQHRVERRTARRVTSSAVNALLVVATLAGLAYLAPSLLGYQRYVITGGSMTGTIDKGSIVLEKAVPVADLAVGDVITYQPPADSGVPNLVTHRIIEIGTAEGGGRLLRTQGDANPQPDPWRFSLTAPTQPVVRHHVPHVGWVLVALADRDVRVLVLGVPAGLVALASAVELLRALREGRRGRDRRARAEQVLAPSSVAPATP
ncbi:MULTISPECIES: signal peptidase I [Aeromicrobium]|jgi:signal peptidase|uniref:signal peptidase I n=2 Tax=Nocardioidaceae TaxID=85015 RepID=UPI000836481E|nr:MULTISPECIES: signal peptidase I [Aeromicrobium]